MLFASHANGLCVIISSVDLKLKKNRFIVFIMRKSVSASNLALSGSAVLLYNNPLSTYRLALAVYTCDPLITFSFQKLPCDIFKAEHTFKHQHQRTFYDSSSKTASIELLKLVEITNATLDYTCAKR